ncbi:MAG: transposase [Magnetococcales bacterium]|nr:transposase [Magnetococcales bacterium]
MVDEVMYGVAARGSVRLTEIGRALEERIPLSKTETRLSRNLARETIGQEVGASVLREGAGRIQDRTLLILDPSDLTKPYAKKMEFLAKVRDGSAGKIASGYWLCQVVGVENGDNAIIPLHSHLYSQEAPGFLSENAEILMAVEQVSAACENRGVWIMDRGGDRGALLEPMVDASRSFIIRLKGNRHLIWGQRHRATSDLARDCPLRYSSWIVREEHGKEVRVDLEYGFRPVRLPERPEVHLWMVVVQGLGKEPLMLLTNTPLRRRHKDVAWVVNAYFSRWRIEEAIRFVKQSYSLEDIRVLTYERLQNMVVLVNAVAFFTTVILGTRLKLDILATHLTKASKRVFGVPDFRFYALADGIREVCARSPR